ncbi:MAG: YdcF family protein [Clostridia bacterium]|nr:YdcF family protein [Clostridia bacterium]
MAVVLRWVLLIFGGALVIDGAVMAVVSNFNAGVILTVVAGLFFLLWGIFYKKIKERTRSGTGKAIKIAVVVCILIVSAFIAFLACYGQCDNADYNEDAVIVLGAGVRGETVSGVLRERLETALEYYEKNSDAVIVVTGAQGYQESVSESYAMKKYLTERGVPEAKIIEEDKAHNTKENIANSMAISDAYFDGEIRVAIITNEFHIFRAVCIAKDAGIENVSHVHAGTAWYNLAPCYLRECAALVKYFLTR